jgi:RHS repeat-associated protein
MGPGIDFPLVMNYSDTEMPNGTAYFYFLSGHNDVAYFSNSTFDDFETYEYNPWGVLLTQANKNNLLYTSREFDFETGLQFNRMRYYLPNLGRFSQKDLIYMKAANAFAYASDNPINFLDPFGLYNRGGMIPGMSLGPGYGGGGASTHEGTCNDPIISTECWNRNVCPSYEACENCCELRLDNCLDDCPWWNVFCQLKCYSDWKYRDCTSHCYENF